MLQGVEKQNLKALVCPPPGAFQSNCGLSIARSVCVFTGPTNETVLTLLECSALTFYNTYRSYFYTHTKRGDFQIVKGNSTLFLWYKLDACENNILKHFFPTNPSFVFFSKIMFHISKISKKSFFINRYSRRRRQGTSFLMARLSDKMLIVR